MSLAPEECSRRLLKAPNKLKLTENEDEGASQTRSSVGTTSMSKHEQASHLTGIDKPIDEVADIQQQIGDNNRGMHSNNLIKVGVTGPDQARVPVQEQMSLGDALTNEQDPLRELSVATSGLSPSTMTLSEFDSNALLMSPSFGSQYDDQAFTSSVAAVRFGPVQGRFLRTENRAHGPVLIFHEPEPEPERTRTEGPVQVLYWSKPEPDLAPPSQQNPFLARSECFFFLE